MNIIYQTMEKDGKIIFKREIYKFLMLGEPVQMVYGRILIDLRPETENKFDEEGFINDKRRNKY